MNIGGLLTGSLGTEKRGMLKLINAEQQNKNELRNDKDKKTEDKKSGSMMVNILSKREMSTVEMLMKQKESMQNRMETMQKRITSLDKLIEQIPYELQITTDENGEEKLTKVYTEENQELLSNFKSQQDKIMSNIKGLTEEMLLLESDIKTAMIEEQSKKVEKEKEKQEKAMSSDKKNLTEEELKQEEERQQAEFMIQSDNLKNYIHEGRITKAKLHEREVRIKNWMATDITNSLFSEQRAKYEKDQELPISQRKESPVPDTSFLQERARIESGRYTPDEKDGAEEIKRIQDAIKRTENYINSTIGDLNKNVEQRKDEQEEYRKDEQRKDEQDGYKKDESEKNEKANEFSNNI